LSPEAALEAEDIYYDLITPACEDTGVSALPFIRFIQWGVLESLGDGIADFLDEEQEDRLIEARDEIVEGNTYPNEWRAIFTTGMVLSNITKDYGSSKRALDRIFEITHSEGLQPLSADARIRARLAARKDPEYLEVFEQYRANARLPWYTGNSLR
jgi:hypothetical protein